MSFSCFVLDVLNEYCPFEPRQLIIWRDNQNGTKVFRVSSFEKITSLWFCELFDEQEIDRLFSIVACCSRQYFREGHGVSQRIVQPTQWWHSCSFRSDTGTCRFDNVMALYRVRILAHDEKWITEPCCYLELLFHVCTSIYPKGNVCAW